MKKLLFLVTTLFVVSICFTSCKPDSQGGGDGEQKAQGTTTIKVKKKPKEANGSQVWLDASYSMKGYIDTKEDSHFNGIIGALGNLKGNSGIALFGTSLGQVESYESFNKKLENKNIKWSKESNLTAMIKTAVSSQSKGLIFIITDGIMSGSDKQINKDPNYNKLHCNQLAEEIRSVLKSKIKDVAINVSQYSLKFRGNYYYYDNSHINIVEKKRPLYILTIGPKNKVNEIVCNVFTHNEMLRSDKALTFGDVNMPYALKMNISNHNYFSKGKNTNDFRLNKKVLNDVDDLTFNIVVSVLPKYMRSEDYLKQNGHFQYKKINMGDDSYKDFILGSDYQLTFSKDKLSLTINKTKIYQLSLRYVLDYADPSWVKLSSTDDDKTNYSDNTTFNFEYFMKGLSALNPDGFVNNAKKSIINITN